MVFGNVADARVPAGRMGFVETGPGGYHGDVSEIRRLYLDNAATSFPKPPEVAEAMTHYATEIGASAGRGAYSEAVAAGELLSDTRRLLNQFINGQHPDHIVFTLNCSDALNLAIKGLLDLRRSDQHVVCTEGDHNSILRPLTALSEMGVCEVTHVPVDRRTGRVDPQDIRRACRRETKFIAVTHVSNVSGTVQPIGEIGRVAREMTVPLVVDAAQSIGHLEIDVQRDQIDLLAAPGHKALLGPLGTGFLYLRPGLEKRVRPLREGGTGSRSDEPRQPTNMPDKYEPGSHNAVGIAGLRAGVAWLLGRGMASIERHQQGLIRTFIDATHDVPGLQIIGPPGVKDRIGVFSLRVTGLAPVELASRLEREFGILSRAGIHCAPLMHRALGTLESGGTTRISFGPFVSSQDVKYAADALAAIALEQQAGPLHATM
jgi:cysteine desulfurase / selenocysteine lyase